VRSASSTTSSHANPAQAQFAAAKATAGLQKQREERNAAAAEKAAASSRAERAKVDAAVAASAAKAAAVALAQDRAADIRMKADAARATAARAAEAELRRVQEQVTVGAMLQFDDVLAAPSLMVCLPLPVEPCSVTCN
jgi:hypothetical protein